VIENKTFQETLKTDYSKLCLVPRNKLYTYMRTILLPIILYN